MRGPKEPCIKWGQDPTGRGNVGGRPAHEKAVHAAKGIIQSSIFNNGVTADCNAPDWSVLHYIVSREK